MMINLKRFFNTIGQAMGIGFSAFSLVAVMLFNTGCSTNDTGTESGEVVVSLTDAEGDFLTYAIDVVSMTLKKSDGTEVSSLSNTTTVDFAQYVEVTEFLTAATVPSGTYVSAEVTLDFSNSVITVQDESGNAIPANAIDADGNPLATTLVTIELNGGSSFRVAPGIPAHFTIDFDLESSNDVVISDGSATVTVNPVLIADTQLEEPKPHRLRGLLNNVDEVNAEFDIILRPFLHQRQHSFGSLTAHVATTTHYEVDGVEYTGEAGMAALAALEKGSAVVSKGILDIENRQYNATEILAGTSVPWGTKDILQGSVISRDTTSLTVHGGVILRADGDYQFNENIQVLIDENTQVFKQGDEDTTHLTSDISVGQRVMILGVPAITIGDEYTMDATEGTVRMKYSQVTGLINSVSPLTVNTQRINGRRSVIYDFTDTGSDATADADPANYEINTGTLLLDQLDNADPIKVRGFPQPFGQAPEDFVAKTLIDVSQVVSHMVIGYTPIGSETAITSVDSNGITVNLDGAGRAHFLEQAGIVIDLTTFDAAPYIQPKETNTGLFVISKRGNVNVFADYEAFQTALNDELNNGVKVRGVNVFGQYDSNTNTITAGKIGVQVIELPEILTLN